MPVNGKAVAFVSVGGLFVYSGLSGYSVLKAAQNVIQGKPASEGQTAFLLSANTVASSGNTGTIAPGHAAAKAYAKSLFSSFGWGPEQFAPLDKLWTAESGWRVNADNPHSDAFGIPQALPGSKMASEGADWQTNAATQIRWGLKYIKSRYGTPAGAWAFWQAQSPNHWY